MGFPVSGNGFYRFPVSGKGFSVFAFSVRSICSIRSVLGFRFTNSFPVSGMFPGFPFFDFCVNPEWVFVFRVSRFLRLLANGLPEGFSGLSVVYQMGFSVLMFKSCVSLVEPSNNPV